MKCGQEFVRELPQPPVIAAPRVGFEQLDGFDMGRVLGVDIGLVESAGVLGLQLVEDRLVPGIELVRRLREVGIAHGPLEFEVGRAVVLDHAAGESL